MACMLGMRRSGLRIIGFVRCRNVNVLVRCDEARDGDTWRVA